MLPPAKRRRGSLGSERRTNCPDSPVAGGRTLTDLDRDSFSEILSYLSVPSQFLVSLVCRSLRRNSLSCSDLGRLTATQTALAELSPDSSRYVLRLPPYRRLFPCQTVLSVLVGDSSGENKHQEILYTTNLTLSEIESAYQASIRRLGFDFSAQVCNDMEDPTILPHFLDKIEQAVEEWPNSADDVGEGSRRYSLEVIRKIRSYDVVMGPGTSSFSDYWQYASLWWVVLKIGRRDVTYSRCPVSYQGGGGGIGGDPRRDGHTGMMFVCRPIGGYGLVRF